MLTLDGSILEGGGQVLRQSVAFAALLSRPIVIKNIRAGRPKPGLKAQHLTGIELVSNIASARLSGGSVSSDRITFEPASLKPGNYIADTKTAGSTMLLSQISLPVLLFSGGPSQVHFLGGTNASMAPPVDYCEHILIPSLRRFGSHFSIDLQVNKRGFFPVGRGEVLLSTSMPPNSTLSAIDLTERGQLVRIDGTAWIAGKVPRNVGPRMAAAATEQLRKAFGKEIQVQIKVVQMTPQEAVGTACGVFLIGKTDKGCLFGADALGERGVSAEAVGSKAALTLIDDLRAGGCVDQYLQDQLIIFMALAQGRSRMLCGPLTLHTRTAIHFAREVAGVEFTVSEVAGSSEKSGAVVVECVGLGYRSSNA